MRHLDAAAYQFVKTVNEVHKQGVGRDGVGNRDLFADLNRVDGAAAMVGLSKDVKGNSEAIQWGRLPEQKGTIELLCESPTSRIWHSFG
jgi:hypothetical protein